MQPMMVLTYQGWSVVNAHMVHRAPAEMASRIIKTLATRMSYLHFRDGLPAIAQKTLAFYQEGISAL